MSGESEGASGLLGCVVFAGPPAGSRVVRVSITDVEGLTVKKLLVLALLGLGGFAVWRKVQADRAEIDLWTEATTGELN
jgi:hypothetical protein